EDPFQGRDHDQRRLLRNSRAADRAGRAGGRLRVGRAGRDRPAGREEARRREARDGRTQPARRHRAAGVDVGRKASPRGPRVPRESGRGGGVRPSRIPAAAAVSGVVFPLSLSLRVALLATLAILPAGIVLAHVQARYQYPGPGLVATALLLPLVLPPTVVGYYLVLLLGHDGLIGGPIYRLTG